jgi:hypothetical protein
MDVIVLTGARSSRHPLPHPRCDPGRGTKRGIAGNAASVRVSRCYVDDCYAPYPGNDTQAFCAWDTPGPITLIDNYFCGGSETVMIGGSDPSSAANLPTNILISGNTITKRPAWQGQAINVKNVLELKNARQVTIENNDLSCSWGGRGQDGFLVMLTPRNQGGAAPYSTVEDVDIIGNRFRSGAAALAILGTDNLHPSQRLARVRIANNTFDDLDPKAYTGSNKMIQITSGPLDVIIDANVFHGVNIGSQIYFDGAPQCDNLIVTNNQWPKSKYGIFGSGSRVGLDSHGVPHAWTQYVASGVLDGNVETPASDTYGEECR